MISLCPRRLFCSNLTDFVGVVGMPPKSTKSATLAAATRAEDVARRAMQTLLTTEQVTQSSRARGSAAVCPHLHIRRRGTRKANPNQMSTGHTCQSIVSGSACMCALIQRGQRRHCPAFTKDSARGYETKTAKWHNTLPLCAPRRTLTLFSRDTRDACAVLTVRLAAVKIVARRGAH